jgi:hypothetical protein
VAVWKRAMLDTEELARLRFGGSVNLIV